MSKSPKWLVNSGSKMVKKTLFVSLFYSFDHKNNLISMCFGRKCSALVFLFL